ncbi:MAG TPA: phosphoenolpyruvate carboxylase, partial [Myxococcota bacterium]|nr:phosphoenolpyruvate carboxylase [Myxococcota bacterium]
MFESKDVPLRNDVNALGSLLGRVLEEQGGKALFERVEAARHAARLRRKGNADADHELGRLLSNMKPDEATEVVRAFSAYFGLVNLAERVHRIRRRRAYLVPDSGAQPGGLIDVLTRLKAQGVSARRLAEVLKDLQVVPVFTAHPTEATRRSLLVKEQRMARALVERFRGELLPYEDAAALGRVRNEVATAWQTDELGIQPTVSEEVEHVVFYLTDVIYRIVPVFYEGLADAIGKVYGPEAVPELEKPLVRFGSWVGGDMDGNPNVGPATIRATLMRHRELILKRYGQELKELFDYLTQSSTRISVDAALPARIAAYRRLLPNADIAARYQDMPYRVLLWLMTLRLEATASDKVQGYRGPEEFHADLNIMYRSLLHNRGAHAGAFRVQRMMRRVETFGFHLATLDVRQDSLVHRRVCGVLLGRKDFADLPAARRTELLQAGLQAASEPAPVLDPDTEEGRALDVMQTISECRARFGKEAVGPYIISMAEGADDVLAVLYIAKRAGLVEATGEVPLDVAPLFETVPDLQASGTVFDTMLNDPLYRTHLKARADAQLVMLGYSDSNKESGIVASRWALQEAQAALISRAEAAGLKLTLFHGRGGTASRGGSKPRAAIMAEPPGAIRGRLRLTEQGEIIHAKYGLRDIALRTLELMGGAVLEVTAGEDMKPPEAQWHEIMRFLAQESRAYYRALVSDDPDFIPYFTAATPIDVISRLRIGSRPAARRSLKDIQDLRAIPWVF